MAAHPRHPTPLRRTLSWCCWWVLVWFGAVATVAQASEGDHIVERAWLEDRSGLLTPAEVRQLPTQAFTGVLSQGFGASVIWLRLRIDPHTHPAPTREPERLVLRIRPVYLDHIQVYDDLAVGGEVGVTGDRFQPSREELEGLDFLLPIARGDAPRDIWLRLASTSTRQIHVQALNVDDLGRAGHRQALVFALYIGLVFAFATWSVVHWLFSRQAVVGAFGVAQSAALAYSLCSLGYLRAFWPEGWPAWWVDQASTLFSIVAVSTAIWFHVILIQEFDPPPWARRLHLGLLCLWPLKVLLLLAGWPILALQINMGEVLLAPWVFLVSTGRSRAWNAAAAQRPVLARPVMLGFYALLVGMLALAALPGLGWTRSGEIALYIVQTHGLVTAVVVLVLLQYRAYKLSQNQRLTTLALERSRLQTLHERQVREDQSKLLAMLAHELKTPLATMQMRLAPGAVHIRHAIKDMNGVIERCLQTAQLSDGQLVARIQPTDLAGLLRDAVAACGQPARVQFQAPERLQVSTDRQLLFIVLNNLLENACKYAAPDSPIELKLTCHHEQPGQIRIDIRNRPGPAGWPDPQQLFDKYYRSPHAKRQAGTGLGLYLTRSLVHTLGGQVHYVADATWVRFVVSLPIVPDLA